MLDNIKLKGQYPLTKITVTLSIHKSFLRFSISLEIIMFYHCITLGFDTINWQY